MILGIGTDIVDIRRIIDLSCKGEERFLNKLYTKNEQEHALLLKEKSLERFYGFLAKRFAAKEAVAKALGTGIGEKIAFKECEILNEKSGRPYVKLYGTAADYLNHMTPKDTKAHIDITLSDEKHCALAYVVISTR